MYFFLSLTQSYYIIRDANTEEYFGMLRRCGMDGVSDNIPFANNMPGFSRLHKAAEEIRVDKLAQRSSEARFPFERYGMKRLPAYLSSQ